MCKRFKSGTAPIPKRPRSGARRPAGCGRARAQHACAGDLYGTPPQAHTLPRPVGGGARAPCCMRCSTTWLPAEQSQAALRPPPILGGGVNRLQSEASWGNAMSPSRAWAAFHPRVCFLSLGAVRRRHVIKPDSSVNLGTVPCGPVESPLLFIIIVMGGALVDEK